MHRLDVTCGIEHLLHARSALGSFVSDDDTVAALHTSTQNALAGIFLRVEHHGRSLEVPQALIYTGGLHHAAVLGNVAKEHRQSAVLGVSMFKVADATVGTVLVKCAPLAVLTAHLSREAVARSRLIYAVGIGVDVVFHYVIFLELLAQSLAIDAAAVLVYQSALGEFVDDAEYSTGTAALLHTVFLGVRSQLAQARSLAAQRIDVLHGEVGASLLSHCQQMEHGVCASTHSDVERHGIEESLASGDVAGQNALVSVLIICQRILHYLSSGFAEEFYSVLVSGENSAVSRQRETDGLGQRVHRVCREHARARAAARTGTAFYLCHFLVADTWVGTFHHSGDKVGVLAAPTTSLHRTSRAEHRRDVQAH